MQTSPNDTFKESQLEIKDLSPQAILSEDFNHAYLLLRFFQCQTKKSKGNNQKHQSKSAETVTYVKDNENILKTTMELSSDENHLNNLTKHYIDAHAVFNEDDFTDNSNKGTDNHQFFENPHQTKMVGNVASRKTEMCGKLFSTLLCQVLDFLRAKCRVKFEDLQNSDQASHDFVDNMISYIEAEEIISYIEAEEKICLRLDHLDPTVKLNNGCKITLMTWQVQEINFILTREKKNIDEGDLADECDLSKTIQMLTAIYMTVTTCEIIKPILILCPVNIIHVMCDNIDDPTKKNLIIDSDEMASFLDELWNTPAIAAKTIIVTRHLNSKKTCKYLKAFNQLVLDEAHHVKSISTETHSIVQSMVYKHIWFNTATLTLNKVTDLISYLNLVWQKNWAQFLPAPASVNKEISEDKKESGDDEQAHKTQFNPEFICEEFCNAVISEDNISVQLLSSSIFKLLLIKGEMLIDDAFEIISKILKILFLK
ncbi:hypothetical protein EMPG_12897 [Blastomyces silverae]|uniref:SNF2 N-terminal domain-containing protein n=1 Tax=Blastomyces silverae TaxID=2060906 RepID=A0A0H1BS20_9EURO|nr:hypothetical protein EMPG_12897 [Blastomyces silverae]